MKRIESPSGRHTALTSAGFHIHGSAVPAKSAFTIVEVLIAIAIVSSLGLPVMYMASQNLRTLKYDRVRIAAEEICHATIERFGLGQDNVQAFLTPVSGEPKSLEAVDLWTKTPEVYRLMGCVRIDELVARNGLSMKVRLEQEVSPSVDLFVCQVSWTNDGRSSKRPNKVVYARFILRDHLH